MKKISLFAVALSAFTLSLASCSSDDEIEDESQIENMQETSEGLYLSMNLNMISAASTRADASEPDFDRGTDKEYAINSAVLLIFEGNKGADPNYSVFKKSYALSTSSMTATSDTETETGKQMNSISSEGHVVAYMKNLKYDSSKSYYALVLVNRPDIVTLPKEEDETTFAAWNQSDIAAIENNENKLYSTNSKGEGSNFYMASALRDTSADGKFQVQSLVDVTEKFKTSRESALQDSGIELYVERGVAKMSFSEANGKTFWSEGGGGFTGAAYSGATVKFLGWYVDNVDVRTYPVHTLGYAANGDNAPAWGIDQIGNTADAEDANYTTDKIYEYMLSTKKGAFVGANNRIYWSFTPRSFGKSTVLDNDNSIYDNHYRTQYNPKSTFYTNVYIDGTPKETQANAATAPYCYIPENCQLYKYMTKGTNTRVIFKAKFIPEGYTEDEDVFMVGDKVIENATIEKAFQDALDDTNINLSDYSNYFDMEKLNKAGVFSKDVLASGYETQFTEKQLEALNKALNLSSDVAPLSYYPGGVCYYVAYVRHLSEDKAKWETGDYTINQLGRYGIVRNNWYDMQVTEVTKPGKPYVPDLPGPDDNDPKTDDEEYYIKVNVTILSWVKHSTSVSNLE